MRILSPQLGLSPQASQGGAVFDREVLRALAVNGVDVDIILPRGEEHDNLPNWTITQSVRHRLYFYEYNYLFFPHARQLWRKRRWDIYRVSSATIAPLALMMQRMTGQVTIAHYHHFDEEQQIQNRFSSGALLHYDAVTVDSIFAREQLASEFGIDMSRAVVTYPGVAPQYTPGPCDAALRASLGIANCTSILTLGMLTARKNLLFLFDCLQDLLQKHPDVVLVIAGEGPQRSELVQAVERAGIADHVRFTGFVDEATKLALLRSVDIFAFPSKLEGFGMAVAEAMACRLPVVSSNAASLPEVTGEHALLASPFDRAEFSAALERLVDDAALRKALGAAGQAHVRATFNWHRTAAITLGAYEEAIRVRRAEEDRDHKP